MAPLSPLVKAWTAVEAHMPRGWRLTAIALGPREADPVPIALLPGHPRAHGVELACCFTFGMRGERMSRAEISTTINRPVDEVFAALTRFEDSPKWSSVTLEAEQTSPGPVGVGSTARYVAKFLGRRFEGQIEVTEYEPNRKISDVSTGGPIPIRSTISAEPADGGTRLKVVVDLEPGGFFRIAEPLVVAMAKRQLEADFSNLKDLMEAGAL